jgi:hypothetical protein
MIPRFAAQLVFLASNEAFVKRRDAAEAIYGIYSVLMGQIEVLD